MHIYIAMAANVAQIIFMVYLGATKTGSWDANGAALFVSLIAVPCITLPLLYDLKYNMVSSNKPTSWFGLFLQRKRLEEQQKIKSLTEKSSR